MLIIPLCIILSCFSLAAREQEAVQNIPCAGFAHEIVSAMQEQQVQCVSFLFTDIHGSMKEVIVPIEHVADAIDSGLAFDGSSVPGYAQICASDMLLKPDMTTARIIPWFAGSNKTVAIICDVYKTPQDPHEGDPRRILINTLKEADDLGYVFYVGPEIEFFFIKKDEDTPIDTNAYCDLEHNAQHFIHKSSLLQVLKNFGIDVEKLHHEVANGQHEISIRYGNALNIADQVMLAKFTLQSISQEYGYRVSFMPKPYANQNGSAMHLHFSLWDIFQQQNAFYNGKDDKLSAIGQQFVAGVLYHVNDLAAIFNPTINSYKRLVPGYEAPTYICWGTKNRSALLRVPQVFQQRAVRAELRCPDPMSNPYLAFAALLKAGIDGIKNKRALMQPVEENLYALSVNECKARNIDSLPGSLEEAVYNLQHSTLAKNLFGQSTLNLYVDLKQKEIRSYNTHISAWEWQRYR